MRSKVAVRPLREIRRSEHLSAKPLIALSAADAEREVGVVLPVGCGKSGTITLTPFAVLSRRTLVVAPGINIAGQLAKDFDPTNPDMFYQKCRVLDGSPYPEPVVIKGTTTNRADLEEADVVITNIQQLQGSENLPPDFFDLILLTKAIIALLRVGKRCAFASRWPRSSISAQHRYAQMGS
ncbi:MULTISPECIES: DEAD/DEAH box helicase family protein [unclassified Bradyrhizobium]|uniref:DEAD/DEAH box helicase family protein n=1 Tax=unclassified Bradyrhizobium TaxID=2631580 RepID=UPI001FFF079A|nr:MULTISPECIES: DEAD/DEAH box helicase family protein [unclassified Bradyrhizobium]